ncbi:hypothetical protein BN2537_919 [Streptomyces venezuelae]|nr:hypothetical protein BN2537_919 [Streptomyces venezuelae]
MPGRARHAPRRVGFPRSATCRRFGRCTTPSALASLPVRHPLAPHRDRHQKRSTFWPDPFVSMATRATLRSVEVVGRHVGPSHRCSSGCPHLTPIWRCE